MTWKNLASPVSSSSSSPRGVRLLYSESHACHHRDSQKHPVKARAAPTSLKMEVGHPDSPTVKVAWASSPVQAPLGAEGSQGFLLLGEHKKGRMGRWWASLELVCSDHSVSTCVFDPEHLIQLFSLPLMTSLSPPSPTCSRGMVQTMLAP